MPGVVTEYDLKVPWTTEDDGYSERDAVTLFCSACAHAIAIHLDPRNNKRIGEIKLAHVQAHKKAGHLGLPPRYKFHREQIYPLKPVPSRSAIC